MVVSNICLHLQETCRNHEICQFGNWLRPEPRLSCSIREDCSSKTQDKKLPTVHTAHHTTDHQTSVRTENKLVILRWLTLHSLLPIQLGFLGRKRGPLKSLRCFAMSLRREDFHRAMQLSAEAGDLEWLGHELFE